MEHEAYRFKAPSAENREAVARIARQEAQDYEVFRRQQLQPVHCSGILGGSAASLQHGREALLSRVEKESDPVRARLKKKEEAEKKKREQEEQRVEEKRRRDQEWSLQQQRTAAANRIGEAAKQAHWQARQSEFQVADSPGPAQSPSIPSGEAALPEAWQCDLCTLCNPVRLQSCDACGSMRCASERRWQCAACTLVNNCGETACRACGQTAAQPSSEPAARPHPTSLLVWLERHTLALYEGPLVRQGYDLHVLEAMEPVDLAEMFKLVQVLPAHRVLFRRALGMSLSSTRVSTASLECSVCLQPILEGHCTSLQPCGHVFCREHAEAAQQKDSCHTCRRTVSGLQALFV